MEGFCDYALISLINHIISVLFTNKLPLGSILWRFFTLMTHPKIGKYVGLTYSAWVINYVIKWLWANVANKLPLGSILWRFFNSMTHPKIGKYVGWKCYTWVIYYVIKWLWVNVANKLFINLHKHFMKIFHFNDPPENRKICQIGMF